ncbi:MAG: tyrosine-protein phosphatase [Puniceicoccales bacterium]|nr:tyrosine-protein phosphatase [Puniceicoccales bacterium]
MKNTPLGNLHQVSHELYRSSNPRPDHLPTLQHTGIKTIINLRTTKPDTTDTFRNAGLTTHWHPMQAGTVTPTDLITALRLLKHSPKPALIHCRRGADRTGFILAGYRIVHQGWTKQEAIREMRKGGFGFYEGYGNIIKTLENLDPDAIRRALDP